MNDERYGGRVAEDKGKWLSVSELSKQANVPESTARRYVTHFRDHFNYETRKRGRRYSPESIAILSFIQNCYGQGMEKEEIERVLLRQFPAVNIETSTGDVSEQVPQAPILMTKGDLMDVMNEIRAMREENKQLHEYIEKSLLERDQKLMETLRQMMELKNELAVTKSEDKKKRGFLFWRR